MEDKQQELSKERIKAEMKDVEEAAKIRLYFGVSFVISAVFAIFAGVAMAPFLGGVCAIFIVVGIALGVGGILLIRSCLAKRRQYNDLKRRL